MSTFKLYEKYKESGHDWLGCIPDNWTTKRAKWIFREVNHRSKTGNEELLSVSEHYGVIKRKNANVNMFKAESYEGYKLCNPGDLVINSLWAWSRGLGFSRYYGIVSTAYGVYRPKPENVGDFRYFHYLLRTNNYVGQYRIRSKGVWISRLQLSDHNFLDIPILLPPKREQEAIARYLDHKAGQIDRFIRKKKQLIKLLNEQKAAIINQAVTKGINPNAPMKDSGIEWLGEIPEHWNKVRLRYLTKITTGGKNTEDRVEDGEYDFYVRSQIIEKINSYSFDGEGILTAGDGAGVGKIFHYAKGKFNFHQRVYLFFDFASSVKGEFLFNYLKANLKTELMMYNAKSTVDSVRLPVLKDFIVCIPPEEEQYSIVHFINNETKNINDAISIIEKEIALTEEYRTALIAEAVTGKIDVREYKIPETVNEEIYEEIYEELSIAAEDEAEYENV